VKAVLAANAPKFTGVVPADAEDLLEQLTVYGTPGEARRRLTYWLDAGVHFPVLLLLPNLSQEDFALTFQPLLQSGRSFSPTGAPSNGGI
jgi:alkanesulfonate monooxygenase SsuD/methylene tetrahydromethanopterin reductase-like flavin-dependent oxidoreductase (luciferase family)